MEASDDWRGRTRARDGLAVQPAAKSTSLILFNSFRDRLRPVHGARAQVSTCTGVAIPKILFAETHSHRCRQKEPLKTRQNSLLACLPSLAGGRALSATHAPLWRQSSPPPPPARKERKKENRHAQTRDGGGGQGPHLHEQDFGPPARAISFRSTKTLFAGGWLVAGLSCLPHTRTP